MQEVKKILFVTGGAGFIGSAVIRELIKSTQYYVVNIDKLTYAGNLESLSEVTNNPRYIFRRIDICDKPAIAKLFDDYKPCGVLHLAAESHVDRSISSATEFINTNIIGTYTLLECARDYFDKNKSISSNFYFKFVHVSTDEVFGSLGDSGYFNEHTPYDPRSPYSASKASSDMLVRAWFHTYNLPIVITNCTNNYGPYHFPEKLIPLIINNALQGKKLPIYGSGKNVRDWLYVDDHARGIILAYEHGKVSESYCIGGGNERTNLQVVETICSILDDLKPIGNNKLYRDLITYVEDRAGHDYRYAIDSTKIQKELGWIAKENFESGIYKTVEWYLSNQNWVKNVQSGEYQKWVQLKYDNLS